MENNTDLALLDEGYTICNILKERALKGDILSFIKYTKPDYEISWHHKVICKYINRFISGEITRLMIFIAPRHGKSEIISRRLPAFIHGLDPNAEIMACTYNAELAGDMTKDVQRIMDRPDYHSLFPNSRITPEGSVSKYARNSTEHELMPIAIPNQPPIYLKGKYRAQGVSGSFSGRGGNCLVGKTKIITEIGILYIEDICCLRNKPKVLSYNHETNSCEWKFIKATQKSRSRKIIKLLTTGNRQLECTQEHRVYSVRSGYTESLLLTRRDSVVIVNIQKQTLYRSPQKEQRNNKSNNTMFYLSHGTPQVETDSISIFERISTEEIDVYDIEVEGNNNFFANEILVHNCIIIDDPIKNREEAVHGSSRRK